MTIQWMHFDALNADWLDPAAPVAYIFDDAHLNSAGWGLKRILFVYETLLELSRVDLYRGSTVEILAALGSPVISVDSPDPWLRQQFEVLRSRGVELQILPAPVFVELPPRTDLRRFARYWKKAEPLLFPDRP